MPPVLITTLRRLILGVFTLWCLFPIYWIFSTSFKKSVDATASPPIWLFIPTFENYIEVFTKSEVMSFFLDSLIVGLGATGLGLLVGIPTAYVLARHDFKGRTDYDFWVLSTRMTPPVAMLIPFFVMYRTLGLQDSHLGLIIAHVTQNLAIIIWVMKGFFGDLPPELEEAGLIDGCSYWQAFRHIILPLAWPGIAATGILAFIFSWNEFLFALVLTDTQIRTVPIGLYGFIGYQQIYWSQLAASAMLMLIPVLIFVFIFQRQLIRGLTFGAVRG
ncbi:MAG: carbohydrate ABC transporter permease [Anaerolineae bacterium]